RETLQQRQQAEHAQVQQANFNKWAEAQDAQFNAAHPDYNEAIRKAAVEYVKENWNLTDEQVTREWNTNPNLRSAGTQNMIYEVAKARVDRAGLESKRVRAAPSPVQRPGIRHDGPSIDESEIARTIQNLPNMSQRDALRAAANAQARLRAAHRPRNPNGTWM